MDLEITIEPRNSEGKLLGRVIVRIPLSCNFKEAALLAESMCECSKEVAQARILRDDTEIYKVQ